MNAGSEHRARAVNEMSGITGTSFQFSHVDTFNQQFMPPRERVIPRELPPHSPRFTNRTPELKALHAILNSNEELSAPRQILVDGQPGIGRTDLVARFAQPLGDRFPDGFVYCDLETFSEDMTVNVVEALGSMLRSLNVPEEVMRPNLYEQSRLWRSVSAGLELLVVLDNIENPGLKEHLLPSSAKSTVIFISHVNAAAFVADGAERIPVPPLTPDHSMALLSKVAGEERVETDRQAARGLIEICAGRPKEVSTIGSCLATAPDMTVAQLLRIITSEAKTPRPEVAAIIAKRVAEQTLTNAAQQMYSTLRHHPRGEFPTALAASLADSANVTPLLDELRDAGLVKPAGEDRWQLNDSSGDDIDPGEVRKIIDWYIAVAHLADTKYLGHTRLRSLPARTDPPAQAPAFSESTAIEWLEEHLPDLLTLQRYAADAGWDEDVVALEDALWVLYRSNKHSGYQDSTSALTVEAARRLGDAKVSSRAHAMRGRWLMDQQRYGDALEELGVARELALSVGDERLEASAVEMMGRVHLEQQRFAEARTAFEFGLEVNQRLGHRRAVGLMCQFLARAYENLDQPEVAEGYFLEAREYFVQTDSGRDEGSVLLDLGEMYQRQGKRKPALLTLDSALKRLHQFKQYVRLARTFTLRGQLYQDQGMAELAIQSWQQALEIHEILRNTDSAAAEDVRNRLAAALGEAEPAPAASP